MTSILEEHETNFKLTENSAKKAKDGVERITLDMKIKEIQKWKKNNKGSYLVCHICQ